MSSSTECSPLNPLLTKHVGHVDGAVPLLIPQLDDICWSMSANLSLNCERGSIRQTNKASKGSMHYRSIKLSSSHNDHSTLVLKLAP